MTSDEFKNGGKPQISLAELKQIIRDIALVPGWDDEDDLAALVMLAPLSIGTLDPEAVSRFTGVPLPEVRGVYDRLAENGVLGPGGHVHLEWDDPKHGKHIFLLDVFVATGKLRRANRRQVVVMPAGGGSGH